MGEAVETLRLLFMFKVACKNMNICFPIYVLAALADYKYIILLFMDKLSPHSVEKQKSNDRLEM